MEGFWSRDTPKYLKVVTSFSIIFCGFAFWGKDFVICQFFSLPRSSLGAREG